jgi:predicted dehydrogenase
MLADPEVGIVTVCTPSGAHRDPAVAAALAGKHVVVEKPLEITLQRCDDIINACEKTGVKLCTIFPSRFSPANMALKAAIDAGRFGRLTLGDTYVKWWRTQEYYDAGGWRGTWALDGGGAFMNQAIHNVDLLCWLMGDVTEIVGFTGTLAHERIEVEDVGVACLKFANGAIGVMEATTAAWPGLLKKTEIHGTQGTAIVEQDSIVRWEFADEKPEDAEIRTSLGASSASSGGASDPKAISYIGHQLQLEDFVDSIAAGRRPRVDGADARKSVEVILAIYEAAKTGQSQKLPKR